jgi:hypothetical protein
MTVALIAAAAFGFFTGGFFFLIVGLITLWVVSRNKTEIVRTIEKVQTYTQAREKPTILKVKSDAEEAWEAIQIQNMSRGGITEQELKNL